MNSNKGNTRGRVHPICVSVRQKESLRYVTYDSTIGLRVDGTEAFQLHHGFGLLSLLTTTLQVPIKKIHHLNHRQHEGKHSVRQNELCGSLQSDAQTGTCLRHQARPRVIL